jgi:DNA modification methylase/predicted RNA-binding Zn-ribbon protein involved in translation (DUF1610 family)
LERLRAKLKDPEFRKIEGFPIGSDEDILALSDPPYYTACPNPFVGDLVEHYGKPYDPEKDDYRREPFAADVSEGKNDPIYNAHSYHTKVPHKAIMRYILHYTEPGDMVFDGFCGTGMTGVAAQLCGDRRVIESLGYRTKEDGTILDEEGRPISKVGARRAVLNDLSPAATFIANNYNTSVDVEEFEHEANRILEELETEYGWMYETLQTDEQTRGRINYTVWSSVLACPNCTQELIFLEVALDLETKRVRERFPCPHCGAELSKNQCVRLYETYFDPVLGESMEQIKRQPVLINYNLGNNKFEKKPDDRDLILLQSLKEQSSSESTPTNEIPFMHMTHQRARMDAFGITHVHHFYLPRPARVLGVLWEKVASVPSSDLRNMLLFWVEQAMWTASLLNRYRPTGYSQVNQYLTGVYYVPSQHSECSPWYILGGKLNRLVKAFHALHYASHNTVLSTGTAATLPQPDERTDYIFTDPPFGENIYYADLNFLVESWHRVWTAARPEAIVDRAKQKGLLEYQDLMTRCFEEYHRVLKPGRWMTLVFHNSSNSVWNTIQEALQRAKFVVADVRTLDKQQGSYRQVTSTAVKQDLVISAYKPGGELERRFELEAGKEEGVWDFVGAHLRQLPVFVP